MILNLISILKEVLIRYIYNVSGNSKVFFLGLNNLITLEKI